MAGTRAPRLRAGGEPVNSCGRLERLSQTRNQASAFGDQSRPNDRLKSTRCSPSRRGEADAYRTLSGRKVIRRVRRKP
jgi:hypothetical protein